MMKPSLPALTFLLSLTCSTALVPPSVNQNPTRSNTINRRDAFSSIIAIGAGTAFFPAIPRVANAAEDNQVLSDDEMAARVARKQELLRAAKSGGGKSPSGSATDIRSDVNPEAAVNLRSRSAIENAKIAMEKQREMKTRDTAQKREDLCEMLGRGC